VVTKDSENSLAAVDPAEPEDPPEFDAAVADPPPPCDASVPFALTVPDPVVVFAYTYAAPAEIPLTPPVPPPPPLEPPETMLPNVWAAIVPPPKLRVPDTYTTSVMSAELEVRLNPAIVRLLYRTTLPSAAKVVVATRVAVPSDPSP
jgi:hypothetical protein